MVVDIGGGTTEVAIISLGGVVVGKSLRVGGDEMNQAIIRFMKRKYNLEVGDRTAEQAKIHVGYATNPNPEDKFIIRGRNLATGMPNSIEVKAEEISEALVEPLNRIIETIRSTLEKSPPEIAADIMETGMVLTGGGALLKNIDLLISKITNMPVHVADEPLTCVAKGTGQALERINLLKRIAISY
jgi:rod shape-determining protein MreB